jgi:NTP pyrophosphatase (non-canonical NTP hydrolase)
MGKKHPSLVISDSYHKSPFARYFNLLSDVDKSFKDTKEFGSILILTLVEEVGEMSRAYLAEHGRKKSNLAAQRDETYEQELGDILVAILRFAKAKNINLHERILYTIGKIRERQIKPKE